MIQKIHLRHFLNKNTIDNIRTSFPAFQISSKYFYTDGCDSSFFKLSLNHINSESCQMDVIIDYAYFNCKYEFFPSVLFHKYTEIFGEDIVSGFPSFNECFCVYVEYTTLIKTENAKKATAQLNTVFKKENINRKLWNAIEVQEGEIAFLLHQKNSYHIQALAKCYSSALVKLNHEMDSELIPIDFIMSLETERSVFKTLIDNFFTPAGLDCKISDAFLRKSVFVVPIENEITVNEIVDALPTNSKKITQLFLKLGNDLKLNPKTRYSSSGKCWKCSWHIKRPGKRARVLFTIDFQPQNYLVKANLANLEQYIELMNELPSGIRQAICEGYDCKQCNTRCGGGWSFCFQDNQYLKCTGLNYIFAKYSEDDYQSIISLLLRESEY